MINIHVDAVHCIRVIWCCDKQLTILHVCSLSLDILCKYTRFNQDWLMRYGKQVKITRFMSHLYFLILTIVSVWSVLKHSIYDCLKLEHLISHNIVLFANGIYGNLYDKINANKYGRRLVIIHTKDIWDERKWKRFSLSQSHSIPLNFSI